MKIIVAKAVPYLLLSMVNIVSILLLSVLVLEVPVAELDEVKRALPGLMGNVAQLSVPLLVEVGAGPDWDKAH